MKFLLLLYGDDEGEQALGPEGLRRVVDEHVAFGERLRKSGALVVSEALRRQPKTRRGGLVTDGPFAETKEQLGGFYLLECAGESEALAWAGQVPDSPGLVVEVVPVAGL